MSKNVAAIAIDAVAADDKLFVINLEIGTPYYCGTEGWACPVSLHGLADALADARGADSFHALCMAICVAQDALQSFRENGGKLYVDGEDFPLEHYGFGAARLTHPRKGQVGRRFL